MNNDFIVRQSEMPAERVVRETENEPTARVGRASVLALNREPTAAQVLRANEIRTAQERQLSERTTPPVSAFVGPCRTIGRFRS